MKWQPSIKMLTIRRNAQLKRLSNVGPFVAGSLVRITRSCGNPNCCCARGKKHPAALLTHQIKGKTKSIYIPIDLLEEVKKWTTEYRQVKKLLRKISTLGWAIIHSHVPTKRAASQRQLSRRHR